MLNTAVIGGMYGDEGKGLTTDWLAYKMQNLHNLKNGAVVRYNSSHQAGHTVKTFDGMQHVFHGIGSGTFSGIPTILSKYFVCNPILFLKEYNELQSKGVTPKVFVDKRCFVTTPFDMIANQIKEMSRGKDRHGSCGVGFGETIGRNETVNPRFMLTVLDLINLTPIELKAKLVDIRDNYYKYIGKKMGVRIHDIDLANLVNMFFMDAIIERFIKDCYAFIAYIRTTFVPNNFDFLIFEGAQGLMLDMDHPNFPYVTRSKTGVTNVLRLCTEWGIHLDEAIYVSRCYTTRHGAGPLTNEGKLDTTGLVDTTNVPNMFQGTLRYAPFNLDQLEANIKHDTFHCEPSTKISKMITCLDQITEPIMSMNNSGAVMYFPKHYFMEHIANYTSEGPTRDTVS